MPTAGALRRLVFQLIDIGLPVEPFWQREGGLAFDLLSSYSESNKVTIGHYFQNVLVENGPGADRYLAECRRLFGDEQASYSGAIERHYTFGPPDDWHHAFISEYATMHPWEDFAECFAHYLHITDTIDTSREAGMVLHADKVRFAAPRDAEPLASYDEVPVERLLFDWRWISLFFNRVNTAMGKNPLYPFTIPPPVVAKLGFVHRVVRDTAREDRS